MERIEVYRDKAGEHRWRHIAANGEILSDSSEGYVRRDDCVEMAERVSPGIPIHELEDND